MSAPCDPKAPAPGAAAEHAAGDGLGLGASPMSRRRKPQPTPKQPTCPPRTEIPQVGSPADSQKDGGAAPSLDAAGVLDQIVRNLHRFLVLPPHAAEAIALWALAAHAVDSFDVFALLAVLSPTKRCGKTTLLDALECVLPQPLAVSNATAASLFRLVDTSRVSLLIDEFDSFWKAHPELRNILNASHKKSKAYVIRVEEEKRRRVVRRYCVWGPKVLAVIGTLPDTLADRALVMPMRRKAKHETRERARDAALRQAFAPLCQRCSAWAAANATALREADPKIPDALDDRAADNWHALFAVADLAGGLWPDRARQVAVYLSKDRARDDDAPGVQLLSDLRVLFLDDAGTVKLDRL